MQTWRDLNILTSVKCGLAEDVAASFLVLAVPSKELGIGDEAGHSWRLSCGMCCSPAPDGEKSMALKRQEDRRQAEGCGPGIRGLLEQKRDKIKRGSQSSSTVS